MDGQIWIRQGEDVQGPFRPDKVLELTRAGRITPGMFLSLDRVNWRTAADAIDVVLEATTAAQKTAPVSRVPPPRTAPSRRIPAPERPPREEHRKDRRGAAPRRVPTAILLLAGLGALGIVGLLAVLALPSPAPADAPPTVRAAGKSSKTATAAVPSAVPAAPLSTAEVVKKVVGSVALLRDSMSSGTGFVVGPGVLVTCAHVVRTMVTTKMSVVFPSVDRTTYAVEKLLYLDDAADICLLKIQPGRPPLDLPATSSPSLGEEVLLIGNPGVGDLVVENAVSRGLAGAELEVEGRRVLQVSASVNPGNSGGPLLRSDGSVAGMVSLRATKEEGIAFAVPSRELRAAMARAETFSEGELARLGEMQLGRALFIQIAVTGHAYVGSILAYVKGLQAALEAGAKTVEDAQPYLPDLQASLKRIEEATGKNLNRYVELVAQTSWRDGELAADLSELQTVTMTLRTRAYAREVAGVLVNLERSRKATVDFMRVYRRLCTRFALDEDDLSQSR